MFRLASQHPGCCCAASVLVTLVTPLAACSASAEDVVHLHPDRAGDATYGVRGEIVESTGRELLIRVRGGRERRFRAERVARIETRWPEGFDEGGRAAEANDFAAAAKHFVAARRAETRPWAKRIVLAELVTCYHALGRDELAGEAFLAITESDPHTPAYDRIPLAWFAADSVSEGKAAAWMARPGHPPAVLLGASHLMATGLRASAVEALRKLAEGGSDARVTALAEAQLWRPQIVTADAADLRRWQRRIEKMPPAVRGGPYFLLAEANARLGLHDAAALAYLRPPIRHHQDRPLAARSLLGAARSVQRAGYPDEAEPLLIEVVQTYRESPDRTPAERQLSKLQEELH